MCQEVSKPSCGLVVWPEAGTVSPAALTWIPGWTETVFFPGKGENQGLGQEEAQGSSQLRYVRILQP